MDYTNEIDYSELKPLDEYLEADVDLREIYEISRTTTQLETII